MAELAFIKCQFSLRAIAFKEAFDKIHKKLNLNISVDFMKQTKSRRSGVNRATSNPSKSSQIPGVELCYVHIDSNGFRNETNSFC